MTYAQSAKTVFLNMLGTLDHLVNRAVASGMQDSVLAQRLTEDMFPLELQFRVALNQVLLAINQVTRHTVPLEESPYQSLGQVRDRIHAVRSSIAQIDLENFAKSDSVVDLTLPNGVRFLMSSEEAIQDWIMPNFYFHVTMAYALLRQGGLNVGKMDFLPHMDRHRVSADKQARP